MGAPPVSVDDGFRVAQGASYGKRYVGRIGSADDPLREFEALLFVHFAPSVAAVG
jgi:hypothetical protein